MPRIPRPPKPAEGLKQVRQGVETFRKGIEEARKGVEEVASALRVESPAPEKPEEGVEQERPTKSPGRGKNESPQSSGADQCPVCSEAANLREFLARRKVERALSQLEKGCDSESLETVKKYIKGEDIV